MAIKELAIKDVTLKDIASAVGVNASTASRALDPFKSHLVQDTTRAMVQEAAKRLGYRGDRVAGALRRGATGTAGVVVADLANPFTAPVIHGISQALRPHHMAPLVLETNDDPTLLEASVDQLLSHRVDVVIVMAARYGDRALLENASRHTPLIVAVRGIPRSDVPQVLHDDRYGGRLAAEHLVELGHRRLAELRGPGDVGNFVGRHLGFRSACKKAGAAVVELPELATRPTLEDGQHLARVLLDRYGDDLPTAVFAHNDLMALGALGVFGEHGLQCPGDISIIGYNDSLGMDHVDPPLTTVAYPGIEVGRAAGELALTVARGDSLPKAGVLIRSELRIRQSTAAPRRAAARRLLPPR